MNMLKAEQPLKGILFIGFGGHVRSLADVALASGIQSLQFFDENAQPQEYFLDFPVSNVLPKQLPEGWGAFPGAGDNQIRAQQLKWLTEKAWRIPRLIAPSATIGVGASLAEGVFLGHHAHIGPFASVGKGSIINTSALLEHESILGEYSHLAVNSTVAGRCQIGSYVFLGAGATVIDRQSICDRVVIGAGAIVNQSIDVSGTYVGVPARLIKSHG